MRPKARSCFLIGADHEDIVREGMIGLYKAIRDFWSERLVSLRRFAELRVRRRIKEQNENGGNGIGGGALSRGAEIRPPSGPPF